MTFDGIELVNAYKKRLAVAVDSNWLIRPHLIIVTDQNMPFMNGTKGLEKILKLFNRALENASDHKIRAFAPKIIIHSGHFGDQIR